MAFDIKAIQGSLPQQNPINPQPNRPAGATNGSTTQQSIGLNAAVKADPEVFVYNGIVIFMWAMGVITALTFIYAGIRYVTAGPDAEKAESAKKIIVGSIIGMLIVLGSFIAFKFAVNVLNDPSRANTTQGVQDLMDEK